MSEKTIEWADGGERVGKTAAGRLLDGVVHLAFPGGGA
jgi:hypothetical protein